MSATGSGYLGALPLWEGSNLHDYAIKLQLVCLGVLFLHGLIALKHRHNPFL